ncbi:class I SAM-dependent methyltransferase [Chitinophaga rhizophila]|uniref:Class I SAM-dependent methyltransferase n=1 Tax=Chitinophaga rhizophila TaxID=2866212 RepID=A0ABS7GCF4_9BACT|nr:class I SAM-dependent methyltransferase [Chitinophaga rhizophila]MBW8685361.1 class I SAM-dependent methyltransferase [Chitinophaga rhizophila]
MEKPTISPKDLARQLRQPQGEDGLRIGQAMNKSNAAIYDMVLDFLGLKPRDRVLEIGFGNGHFIPALFQKQAGIQYTGLDISDIMVEEARKENSARVADGSVQLHLGKTEEMTFAAGAFTKVFAANVLYFWDKPDVALSAIHQVLEKGGELILAIRSAESMRQLPFSEHGFTLYDVEAAEALLEKNSFAVAEVITAVEDVKTPQGGGSTVQLENICLRGIKI